MTRKPGVYTVRYYKCKKCDYEGSARVPVGQRVHMCPKCGAGMSPFGKKAG